MVVRLPRVIDIPDRDTDDVQAGSCPTAIEGRLENRRYALNDRALLDDAVAIRQRRLALKLAALGLRQRRVEHVGAETMEIVLTLSEREGLARTGKFRTAILERALPWCR